MKKVLIITCSIGNGHLTAAKGTEKILNQLYGNKIKVEVVDILEYLSKPLSRTVRSFYYTTLKISPKIYKTIFESSDSQQGAKRLNLLNYPLAYLSIKKLINKNKPDLIFSTWPVFDGIIRKLSKGSKFISMITDSGNVHYAWISSKADYYIVADEKTKKTLMSMKVKPNKIKALGFPVSPNIFEEYDSEKIRKKMDLQKDKFTVLAIANPRKTKRMSSIIENLSKYGENMQTIVVAGKNKQIYKKLSKKKLNKNIHLYEWVDNIAELMHCSDISVTKAGGATTQECIAVKKPIIVYDSLPGQEEGNVDFIEKNSIGIIMTKEKTTEIACKILQFSHPLSQERQTLQKNIEYQCKHNSTKKIGQFIGQQLNL
jgi:processive 1,2-diacylglycerol beta-glucosyltransferase